MLPFKLGKVRVGKIVLGVLALGVVGSLTLVACNSGSTGGGNVGTGTQYVSDGSAGATLTITVDKEIAVGDQTSFHVAARDPRGDPLAFLRIFCDSEKGISIIEPSAGGVAFESTSVNGNMSGVLGGLLPGSYLLDCRGPEGTNLVARESIKISGEIPENFQGFPGAAGGNLGGGAIIDETPDADPNQTSNPADNGIRVTAINFIDAGGERPSGPLDTFQTADCDPVTVGNQPEPFTFTDYKISIENITEQKVLIQTVHFAIADTSASQTSTFTLNIPVDPGATADISGVLISFVGSQSYAGTDDPVLVGTWPVVLTITGVNQNGEDFTIVADTVLTLGPVNNCPAS